MAIATLPRPQTKRLWTYDEMLAELPETNVPMELWDGELIMSPAPTPSHQTVILNLAALLKEHAASHGGGQVFISPLDVVLSPRWVVQPDVLYISKQNSAIIQDRIRGVPDLVVEVISPGSWRRDRVDKKALYEQFGIQEYWIIDLESRTIEIFTLTKDVYRLHGKAAWAEPVKSQLLPGLKISFSRLEV